MYYKVRAWVSMEGTFKTVVLMPRPVIVSLKLPPHKSELVAKRYILRYFVIIHLNDNT